METLGCESALTEVGMERPQRGEATHWAGGALGVNKRPSKRRHGEESTKGLVWEPLKAGLLNPGPNILDQIILCSGGCTVGYLATSLTFIH